MPPCPRHRGRPRPNNSASTRRSTPSPIRQTRARQEITFADRRLDTTVDTPIPAEWAEARGGRPPPYETRRTGTSSSRQRSTGGSPKATGAQRHPNRQLRRSTRTGAEPVAHPHPKAGTHRAPGRAPNRRYARPVDLLPIDAEERRWGTAEDVRRIDGGWVRQLARHAPSEAAVSFSGHSSDHRRIPCNLTSEGPGIADPAITGSRLRPYGTAHRGRSRLWAPEQPWSDWRVSFTPEL